MSTNDDAVPTLARVTSDSVNPLSVVLETPSHVGGDSDDAVPTLAGITKDTPYLKYQELISRSWSDCPDTPCVSDEPFEGDIFLQPIKKVLAQVHPKTKIGKNTSLIVNDMLMFLLGKLGKKADDLLLHKLKALDYKDSLKFDEGTEIIAKRSFPTEAFLMTDPDYKDVFWLCRKTALANKDDTIRARFEAFDKLTDEERAEIYKEYVSKYERENPEEEFSPYGIGAREIQSAVRIVFSGEIAQHAVSNSTKAVTKFRSSSSSDSESKFDPKAWSRAAGLQFPVSVIGVYLGRFTGKYVSPGAAVYLAAVLDYIFVQIAHTLTLK